MIVIDAKVVSVFSCNELSRVSVTNETASVLLPNEALILVFFDSILLLQSLVVRWSEGFLLWHLKPPG